MTIDELKLKRDALILEKRTVETNLMAVKNLVRTSGMMPHEKYRACCDSQTKYARQIVAIESKILQCKQEIQRLADQEHADYVSKNGTLGNRRVKEIVGMLREVRDKWQEFSCDDSLGSTGERTQAAQFVRDLNPVIHNLLDPH